MNRYHLSQINVSDRRHSSICFSLDRTMGETLTGTFADFDATMLSPERDLSTAVLKMTIYTDSVRAKTAWIERRFKGSSCFRVNEYRTITFQSTDWEQTGDNEYLLYGKFCLCGVSKYVVFEITNHSNATHADEKTKLLKLEFRSTIKRSDFRIARGISSWDISDEIQLYGTVAFRKQDSKTYNQPSDLNQDQVLPAGYFSHLYPTII
jgi:polyisoprenoid-binding protein YceI